MRRVARRDTSPLNNEDISVLRRWREQSGGGQRVFEVSTGFRTAWSHLLKRAHITGFRWHDLRHHFASRLVQCGVPLNTVRDLLGHSSVAMSLRYAHLAPDQRREAVAVKIADGGFKHGQQFNCHVARGALTLIQLISSPTFPQRSLPPSLPRRPER